MLAIVVDDGIGLRSSCSYRQRSPAQMLGIWVTPSKLAKKICKKDPKKPLKSQITETGCLGPTFETAPGRGDVTQLRCTSENHGHERRHR